MKSPAEELKQFLPLLTYVPVYNYIRYGSGNSTFVFLFVSIPLDYIKEKRMYSDAYNYSDIRILPIFGEPEIVTIKDTFAVCRVCVPIVLLCGRYIVSLSAGITIYDDYRPGKRFNPSLYKKDIDEDKVIMHIIVFKCERCRWIFDELVTSSDEIWSSLYKALCPECYSHNLSLLDISAIRKDV